GHRVLHAVVGGGHVLVLLDLDVGGAQVAGVLRPALHAVAHSVLQEGPHSVLLGVVLGEGDQRRAAGGQRQVVALEGGGLVDLHLKVAVIHDGVHRHDGGAVDGQVARSEGGLNLAGGQRGGVALVVQVLPHGHGR